MLAWQFHNFCRVFSIIPPPPVKAVAAATSVFTEYVFCESVDSAHNSQISSTFQEADWLLKLIKQIGICNNFIN